MYSAKRRRWSTIRSVTSRERTPVNASSSYRAAHADTVQSFREGNLRRSDAVPGLTDPILDQFPSQKGSFLKPSDVSSPRSGRAHLETHRENEEGHEPQAIVLVLLKTGSEVPAAGFVP
jgi:hypothetical protein